MNIELLKKWVEALRSGKYTQGFNKMRVGNNFCVLGVLCDVYADNLWHPVDLVEPSKGMFDYEGGHNCPTYSVIKRMELTELTDKEYFETSDITTYGSENTDSWIVLLYYLNDGKVAIKKEDVLPKREGAREWEPLKCRRWKFNELADLIENHLIKPHEAS